MLRVWNLSLLCATFSLTILGTFLTRSGVLDSVHAFTESPDRLRDPHVLRRHRARCRSASSAGAATGCARRGASTRRCSREGAFLANNLLFAAFAFVVLLGTVFPLIVEAINGERISVGRPYFDRMTMPIGLALLFLMAIAPVLPWRKTSGELLRHAPPVAGVDRRRRRRRSRSLSAPAGWRRLLAFGLGGFAAGSALRQLVLATRRQGWRGLVGRANGGMIVHLGVVIVVGYVARGTLPRTATARVPARRRARRSRSRATRSPTSASTRAEDGRPRASARARVAGRRRQGATRRRSAVPERQPGDRHAVGADGRSPDDVYLSLLDVPDEDDGQARHRRASSSRSRCGCGSAARSWPSARCSRRGPAAGARRPTRCPRRCRSATSLLGEPDGPQATMADVEDVPTGPEAALRRRRPRRCGRRRRASGSRVVAFVAVLATRSPAVDRQAKSPLLGKPAPEIVGTSPLDGKPFDSRSPRATGSS